VERPDVYCQNCRSQNSLRDTHCSNCGTRLLLVVFPQSLQFDTNHVPSYYEDHLLERVSLLELRLGQMSEALKIAMEIIREQGKIVKENQNQIKLLNKKKNVRRDEPKFEKKSAIEDESIVKIDDILAEHLSPNVELLSKILHESIKLLKNSEEKEAFRMLERAVLLSPRNISLLIFTAQTYYFADKYKEAGKHLERAFEITPERIEILLLLGIICADSGEAEKARFYLSILAENEKTSLVVNLVWGMLAAFEENWSESLAAFKIAAEIQNSAELQYLTGCALFQQNENQSALRHFQKAISLDRNYADAWFMQSEIYRRLNDPVRRQNMVENAAEIKEAGAQCAEFLRKNSTALEIALPFRHFRNNLRIITGGAFRLVRFLNNEIAQAIS